MLTVRDKSFLEWTPIKTKQQAKLGGFVKQLQMQIPTNGDGLPQTLVNPNAVFSQLINVDDVSQMDLPVINSSAYEVGYFDGCPVDVATGVPLWERLNCEPIPYYNLFEHYRDAGLRGNRRTIVGVSRTTGIAPTIITALCHTWHWEIRSAAYDRYNAMIMEDKRKYMAEQFESEFFGNIQELGALATTYIAENMKKMDMKTATKLFEVAFNSGQKLITPHGNVGNKNSVGQPAVNVNIANANGDNSNSAVIAPVINETQGIEEKVGKAMSDDTYMAGVLNILNEAGVFGSPEPKDVSNAAEDVIEAPYTIDDNE